MRKALGRSTTSSRLAAATCTDRRRNSSHTGSAGGAPLRLSPSRRADSSLAREGTYGHARSGTIIEPRARASGNRPTTADSRTTLAHRGPSRKTAGQTETALDQNGALAHRIHRVVWPAHDSGSTLGTGDCALHRVQESGRQQECGGTVRSR